MVQKSLYRYTFIIVCLLALLCASCGGGSKKHLESIPDSSVLWFTADLDDVMSDSALIQAMSIDEITKSLEELGIPPNDVSELTAFGINQSGVLYGGALVTGSYQAKKVVKRLSELGWQEESHKRDKLYRNSQTEEYIAVLYNDTVLLGSIDALKATLDVKRKRQKSLMQKSQTLPIVSDSASSDVPITMGLLMPQETMDMAKAAMSLGGIAFH